MKIWGNITPIIKLVYALHYLKDNKKDMLKYREAEDYENERKAILDACKTWGNGCIRLFNADVYVTGKENLPEKGPVVYVANHQGYADIPVCCAVLNTVQTGFLAKEALAHVPLYGEWIKNIRSVMIERDDARASLRAIEQCIDYIEKGFSMVVFPEGTRSKGGDIGEFKKGSLRMATKPGVPVIPVTINGTYRIFEKTGRITSGQRIDVIIHPAIETVGMDKQQANALCSQVEAIIRDDYAKLKAQGL